MNRTFLNLVRSMLHFTDLEKKFWAEALSVACYVRNRATCQPLTSTTTPFEVLTGEKPDVSNLAVFGCKCFYKIAELSPGKLDETVREALFIGYVPKGYKKWDVQTEKVVISRDAKFFESSNRDYQEQDGR